MANGAPSFWSRLVSGVRAAFRPEDPRRYQQWVQLFDQPAGVTITADNALELSGVWACVNAISNAIAPAPWLVNVKEKGRRRTLEDDPLAYLLNVRPNSDMTAIAFRQAMIMARLLWGNAYAAITFTGAGKVFDIWPMIPHRVVPKRDPESGALFYEYHQMEGGVLRLEQYEVIHVKGPGISGLMGDHVVGRAAKSMGLAMAAERFASTYFGNNTVVGGVLTAPFKFPRDPQGRSSVADRLRDDWAAMHRGPNSAFKPAILEGGMKWEPFDTAATDAQLVESRKFQLEEIARWFGVPGHLIGIAASAQGYGKNLEELSLGFVRNTLRPLCAEFEQEADYKLISQRRQPAPWTRIDLSGMARGDAKTEAEANEIRLRNGVISINEWRDSEGRNHGGSECDVHMVATSMQPLERMIEPPEPAPLALPAPGAGDKQKQPAPEQDPEALAWGAAEAMLAGVFSRYRRQLASRERDLRKGGHDDAAVAANLDGVRRDWRGWITMETHDAATLIYRLSGQTPDLARGLDEVDRGAHPTATAAEIVSSVRAARKQEVAA